MQVLIVVIHVENIRDGWWSNRNEFWYDRPIWEGQTMHKKGRSHIIIVTPGIGYSLLPILCSLLQLSLTPMTPLTSPPIWVPTIRILPPWRFSQVQYGWTGKWNWMWRSLSFVTAATCWTHILISAAVLKRRSAAPVQQQLNRLGLFSRHRLGLFSWIAFRPAAFIGWSDCSIGSMGWVYSAGWFIRLKLL